MVYFIALFGLLLRLSFINKPEGLWNDEYVSWYVANTPFNGGFWQEVFKQCHMPLYYFFLKPFANYSDLVLRLISLVTGVLSIFIMYLVGKEFTKKIGLISATITSILSFLIYYSQEVRFYSLLFLLSALGFLATIKLIKNTNRKNIAFYLTSMVLILFTHVLGVIFVFFNSIYLAYKKKCLSKKNIAIALILFLSILPFGLNIIKMLPSSQWWGRFSYTNILFLFTDYFSPILTNNINAPPVFFYDKIKAIWMLMPCLVIFYPFYLGIKKTKGYFLVVTLTICVLSILASMGSIVFITKYSIEILPILILTLAIGFNSLNRFGNFLLSLFVLIHLSAFFTPYYVTKLPRAEGNRIPAEIIKARNAQNIVFTYYEPNRFERYVDLNKKNVLYISKINRFEYNDTPQKIFNNIKSGETVSVVFLDSVSFFDENYLKKHQKDTNLPEMFVTFSHIKNELIKALNDDFRNFKVDKIGAWTVISANKRTK